MVDAQECQAGLDSVAGLVVERSVPQNTLNFHCFCLTFLLGKDTDVSLESSTLGHIFARIDKQTTMCVK